MLMTVTLDVGRLMTISMVYMPLVLPYVRKYHKSAEAFGAVWNF